jgi:hypothetical protein
LPLFPAVLGNQARDILFGQTELAGALRPIREEFLPAPLAQVTLDRLAQNLAGRTALLVRRGPYLCGKGRRKGQVSLSLPVVTA